LALSGAGEAVQIAQTVLSFAARRRGRELKMAWHIRFADTGEVREMEPNGYESGRSLIDHGRWIEHERGRATFELPPGYRLVQDETCGPHEAIAVRV
jgi:hypothetical protein